MSEAYKDFHGKWHISEWDNGRYYYTGKDGCTYFRELVDEDDRTIVVQGHDNCPCQNPDLKKYERLKKRKK